MAQISVRNLDDDVVEGLKLRARMHGRSLEAQVRAILEENSRLTREEFVRFIDEQRAKTAGRITGDSTDIIREARDSR
jgi:plasmid stability protein